MAAQVVAEHTGDKPGREEDGHLVCPSCKQEKAIVVMLGVDEMDKLFKHVGVVGMGDTYVQAMRKVESGIKGSMNQATARFKLFQEMKQDVRGFREWSQLVVEQADRCDWTAYDKSKAARDAMLFQMDDSKIRRKVIAENQPLAEVIKLGIANEQDQTQARTRGTQDKHCCPGGTSLCSFQERRGRGWQARKQREM